MMKTLAPFSEEELDAAIPFYSSVVVQKNDYFIRAGRISDRIGFVTRGILRSYFSIKGKQTTTFFQLPGSIAAAMQSFLLIKPSKENIQAIENSELIVIYRRDLYKLYKENWKWQQVGRMIMEQYYIHLEQRLINLQSQSAHERYEIFSTSYPEVIQSVPLHYIASYLGISPETLSRVRKAK